MKGSNGDGNVMVISDRNTKNPSLGRKRENNSDGKIIYVRRQVKQKDFLRPRIEGDV